MNQDAISRCARIVPVKTLLKSLIVWLMLLAIPFQGFASATMLVCAPMDSAPQLAAMVNAPVVHHRGDDAGMVSQHHDHASHAVHSTAADDAAAHHHAGGKCNSCATCCFGAIMAPSSASRVAAEEPQFSFLSFEVDRIASVDLAHPERPPQASLT